MEPITRDENCLGYIVLYGNKSEIEVHFRPEHAVVAEPGQGDFKMKVVSSFFMGDRTRLIVNGAAPIPLKVEAHGRQSFNKGQTVDIKLDLQSLFTIT